MLVEVKSTKESEQHGRQSGSNYWKLARGEIRPEADIQSGYTFSLMNDECQNGSYSFSYASVSDQYFRNLLPFEPTSGWIDRVNSCLNIQRKVEHDWNMVYLTRSNQGEHFPRGSISWSIQLTPELYENYQFNRITIQCPSMRFDSDAQVKIELEIREDKTIEITQTDSLFEYTIKDNEISPRLRLIVTLSSSNDQNDQNAWQKAQLFRQSLSNQSDKSHYLQFRVTIIDRHKN